MALRREIGDGDVGFHVRIHAYKAKMVTHQVKEKRPTLFFYGKTEPKLFDGLNLTIKPKRRL